MSGKNNAKLKILYLRTILEEETDSEHGLTMRQLIEKLAEYGVTAERKSVYRDLEILKEFGMDIQTFQRNPVEYGLGRRDFSISELMLLVDAVESSRFLTEKQSNTLIGNIKSLASNAQREKLDKQIHVVGRIKTKNRSVFSTIDTIHQAIQEKKKINFYYYKFGPDKERILQHGGKPYLLTPVKIVYAEGFYYLTAYTKKYDDFSHYRIDRIEKITVSNEPADRNERIANYTFNENEYQLFGSFGGEAVSVVLAVKADKVDIVLDRFGSEVMLSKEKDGIVNAYVTVSKSQQFYGWIAGLDKAVTIASPASLVQEYREYLQKLIND